jgi:alpha-L-fucosidase
VAFQKAVEAFRLDAFMDSVCRSGADYVIFTATHALQMLACPHPVVDGILPGRTCQRDLLGELAQALRREGKRLILYYNHSCNRRDDPEWEQAVGYHDQPKDRLAANLTAIVRWLGERYADLLSAWWFDSPYSLDPSGPHNSVTTDMTGFRFPWERFTEAAKAGHADRLVAYNAGINETYQYTTHQDYWTGELVDLAHPPSGRWLPDGRQWQGWTCLDDRRWVHTGLDASAADPLYSDGEILDFLSICARHRAPMCFNVVIFQDGTVSPEAVTQLRRVGEKLRNR